MDLLILNICETSVTTFLAHSSKESSGLSVNRAELDRTGQNWTEDFTWNIDWIVCETLPPLLLVFVAETRHCRAHRSSWSFARCCQRKLKCFCSERTQLHPSCFHSLLAVPHGIFAPFLSNSFFFFFLCPDFRQVTCTCCRVWSQQSRLTPRCDKGVYVKRCRAALERFNVSNNNTIRRRRHPRPSFAFMLQTVDRARSLLSHV